GIELVGEACIRAHRVIGELSAVRAGAEDGDGWFHAEVLLAAEQKHKTLFSAGAYARSREEGPENTGAYASGVRRALPPPSAEGCRGLCRESRQRLPAGGPELP